MLSTMSSRQAARLGQRSTNAAVVSQYLENLELSFLGKKSFQDKVGVAAFYLKETVMPSGSCEE